MKKQKRENRGQLTVTMAVTALIAFFTLTGIALSARWEVFYEAKVLPDDVSLGENVWTTEGQGFSEIDPPKILHIKTKGDGAVRRFWRPLDDISKVTVEVRIKVVTSWVSRTIYVSVEDISLASLPGVDVSFFEDKITLVNYGANNLLGPIYDVDLTDGYHIVRLVKDGLDVRVYLDNEEKPIVEYQIIPSEEKFQFWGKVDGRFVFTTAPERTWIDENGDVCVKNGSIEEISVDDPDLTLEDVKAKFFTPDYRIYFGCSPDERDKPGESYWDYVAYTTKGAFSPGESLERKIEPQGKLATTWGTIRTVR